MKRIFFSAIFLFLFISIAGTSAVYAAPSAYIDPNTGGMLFQILAVAFTLLSGVIFFFSSRIKMTFARMMRFLREKSGKDVVQETSPDGSSQ